MSSEARPPGDAAVVVDQVADRAGEATAYHAFISYSRQDSLAASGIQKALHRIGRRAGRLHALRVFRDSTDLVANPDLWGRVKDALDDSAYLIVLLSPSAAASRWVNKEVLHWIQQRGLERLLLVLVDGELHWDSAVGCFDPAKSSAALPALTVAGSVPTEPIYVDISRDSPWDPNAATFRDKVIDLAAPIHGKSKYELASDDVREQRRYRRLRGVAVAGLAVLTVVAVAAAGIAFAKQREAVHHRQLADQQREEAIHQRNEAEVRRLLGDADTVLAGNRSGGDFRAFQELLAAHALSPDTAAGGLLDAAIRRSTTKKIIPLPGEQLSAVAISPKGDRIVSAAYEGAVRLLDAHSGRTIATVSENAPDDDLDSQVNSVVFSPDGRWFAARRYDGAIRLWDSESHELIMTIQADDLDGDIAVSADGRRLASLSGGDKLQMWDTTTGGLVDEYTATQNQSMTSVALSRDGRTVGAGTLNGVMLWDIGGNPIGFRPTPEIVNDVAFSPDGSRFVAAETTGDVSAWDARTGNPRGMLTKVGTNVDAVAFTPDGRRLATGSDDGVVRFWDPESGKPLGELRGHTDGVRGISFDSDGARMASAGSDGEVRLWDTGTAGEFPVLDADSEEVQAVDYSSDGIRLATGGNDNIARVWDPTTGALLSTVNAGSESNPIINLALSPDGKQLATVGDFATVRLWDVGSAKMVRELLGHSGQTMAVDYSSDGRMLVTGDIDGMVVLWDPTAGKPLAVVAREGMPVTSVVFSPDGKMIASAGEDNVVQLWDIEQRKLAKLLTAEMSGPAGGLAFSADGQLVAGGASDGTVRVWNTESGKLVQTLTGHNGDVQGVSFSPTAHAILASTGEDNAVRLWNVNTGQPVGAPLAGHTGQVRGVAFSPDGTRVASGGADGKVRFWLAGATPEMFCDKIIYNMNEDQWRQWVSPDVEYRSDVCEGLPAFPG